MKQDIFNHYVKSVCELFSLEEKLLFEKLKRKDVVDARHLLYYLCIKRPMRVVFIQEYLAERGYIIGNSSILYGVRSVSKKIKKDKDYIKAVKDINNAI